MHKAIVKILIISGDKKLTEFMQCADVFEKSKVLGSIKHINISYKKDEILSLKRAGLLIDITKQSLEQSDEIVSFVHVVEIQNKDGTIIKNNGEIIPYFNKEVRCISDGSKWGVFSDLIERLTGLKVITDNHRFIIAVGISLK